MKTLIVYYSYGGNTRSIAEQIQKRKSFDILEIKPTQEYTHDYDDLVDEEEAKLGQDEIIEIEDIEVDLNDYDRIILGSPVWWYHLSPAIRSFLKKYDLKDKTIVPFITNGGWIGHTTDDVQKYAENCTVENGIDIKYDGHDLKTNVESWIENL